MTDELMDPTNVDLQLHDFRTVNIWGFHGDEDSSRGLLGFDAIWLHGVTTQKTMNWTVHKLKETALSEKQMLLWGDTEDIFEKPKIAITRLWNIYILWT
jgi:hypothetical protein